MESSKGTEVVNYLKKIAQHTEPKPSYYVTVTGKDSRLQTSFNPPLIFPSECGYEIALVGLETYYSFPNIDKKNNKVQFSLDKGQTWKVLAIPTGCYEIKAINSTLKRLIKENGGKEEYLCLTPNRSTLQSILTITKEIWINFKGENGTLRTVLGFEEEILKKPGRHESEHIVNILRVNTIFVHCDVVKLSRKNGIASPIIYTFFPNVSPGQKIVNRPRNLIYLPLSLSVISQMTVWLTDEEDNALDTRKEQLTLTFHIRSC